MKYILLFIIFMYAAANAQQVSFKEIKLKPNPANYKTKELTIIYPILSTGKKNVDDLINNEVKNEMFSQDDDAKSIRRILDENISDLGLINLSYEVTYKKNGILSMNIYAEGCGAHCSSWYTWFNFDLKTGKQITIDDLLIVNRKDSFGKIVLAEKVKDLEVYKLEEQDNLEKNYIDSESYRWIIEQVDSNCSTTIDLENFSLSENGISIKDICEYQPVLRSQEPGYDLTYPFKFMMPFLKPAFKKLLQK